MSGTTSWERRRAPLWLAVTVAAVGLVLIGLWQGIPNRHSIQDKLTERSSAALQAAGIEATSVSFTGRDGELVLASAADVDRARDLVADLEGVRVVSARGPQTALQPPAVALAVAGDRVTATGTIASEAARQRLIAALGGPAKVDDKLTVDAGVADTDLTGLSGIVSALGPDAKSVTVELRDGKLTLTGQVASAGAGQAAVTAAQRTVGTANVVDRLGVAAAPEVVQRALTDLPQITFETNSATLTAAGRAAVEKAAAILRDNPGAKVRIEGHTDSNGTPEANLALSRARAQAVLDALVSLGIAADRMTSAGFGETRPRVPDTTPENQALNRRVEFVVQP